MLLLVKKTSCFSIKTKNTKNGTPESLDQVDEERKQNIEAQEGVQGPRLK